MSNQDTSVSDLASFYSQLQVKPEIARYRPLLEKYQQQRSCFWIPNDVDMSTDKADLEKMSPAMAHFAKFLSAFFAISDNAVNVSLSDRMDWFVPRLPDEIRYDVEVNLRFQAAMEDIHSEQYVRFLTAYCDGVRREPGKPSELETYTNAVQNFPTIRAKTEFIRKLTRSHSDGYEKHDLVFLVGCMCVERIMFSASFAGAFYFKSMNLLQGFGGANELISRDEGLHCEVAGLIFDYLRQRNGITPEIQFEIRQTVRDCVEIEKEFVRAALPDNLPNMNSTLMQNYVEYVADHMMGVGLGMPVIYGTANPFSFMHNISLPTKTSFFEARVTQYSMQPSTSEFHELDDI